MLSPRITWLGLILVLMLSRNALAQSKASAMARQTSYRRVKVDDLAIFYREAGPKDAPALLMLHGFPSSSRMFAPLFARLSDRYHLVAPDYPGFGHSDWPDPKNFINTFDHFAEIIDHFTVAIGLCALHAVHARLWWPCGFPLGTCAPGARRSSYRSRRGRTQRRPGRELGNTAGILGGPACS